jgi:hypothetical protein
LESERKNQERENEKEKVFYHVTIVLGIVADHVTKAGRITGPLDGLDPQQLQVTVGEHLEHYRIIINNG